MRILFAEDNRRLAALIRDGLSTQGFTIDWFDRLGDAEEAMRTVPYDLFLLDLGMPDGDGIDLIRRLRRAESAIPVLVITARDGLGERVCGLDAGADDYLVKPFATAELAARCRALLRRPGGVLGTVLKAGNLTLEVSNREVRVDDVPIELTPRETGLLESLLRRFGQVVPRAHLEHSIYSLNEDITPNAIEAAVSRLRKKLSNAGARPTIYTARGIGYTLVGGDMH